MSEDSQIPIIQHPSVLLAFIHDEPTLPERLALSQMTKQDDKERLIKVGKETSKLVDIVTNPNLSREQK